MERPRGAETGLQTDFQNSAQRTHPQDLGEWMTPITPSAALQRLYFHRGWGDRPAPPPGSAPLAGHSDDAREDADSN